jgi:hypothetical protein
LGMIKIQIITSILYFQGTIHNYFSKIWWYQCTFLSAKNPKWLLLVILLQLFVHCGWIRGAVWRMIASQVEILCSLSETAFLPSAARVDEAGLTC